MYSRLGGIPHEISVFILLFSTFNITLLKHFNKDLEFYCLLGGVGKEGKGMGRCSGGEFGVRGKYTVTLCQFRINEDYRNGVCLLFRVSYNLRSPPPSRTSSHDTDHIKGVLSNLSNDPFQLVKETKQNMLQGFRCLTSLSME